MNQKNEMTRGIRIKDDFWTERLQAIFAIRRESFQQQLFHCEQLRLRRREQFVCMHHRLDASEHFACSFWFVRQAFPDDHIDCRADVFTPVLQLFGQNFVGEIAFVRPLQNDAAIMCKKKWSMRRTPKYIRKSTN